MGLRGPQPVNQNDLEFWYGAWLRIFDGMCTGRYIRMDLDFKDERALWQRLLDATTPNEVKAVCDESPFWLNPKRGASMFYDLLSGNAEGFYSRYAGSPVAEIGPPDQSGKADSVPGAFDGGHHHGNRHPHRPGSAGENGTRKTRSGLPARVRLWTS